MAQTPSQLYKLGVNPFDLNKVTPFVLANLLKDPITDGFRISQEKPIIVDKDIPDEQCAVFICELDTAALVIDLLRNEGRQKGNTEFVRAYVKKGDGIWKRIPYAAVLTVNDNGTFIANPKIFPVDEEPAPFVPPKKTFVMRGKK